jgi:hypothetical protein
VNRIAGKVGARAKLPVSKAEAGILEGRRDMGVEVPGSLGWVKEKLFVENAKCLLRARVLAISLKNITNRFEMPDPIKMRNSNQTDQIKNAHLKTGSNNLTEHRSSKCLQ